MLHVPCPNDQPAERLPGAGIDFARPDSVLAVVYARRHIVWLTVGLAAVALLVNAWPLWHTDVWGHMSYGRWIVCTGRFPDREPFCDLADKSQDLIHTQWLSQVFLYSVFRAGSWLAGGDEPNRSAGGIEALRALHALCVVVRCIFLWLAFRHQATSAGLSDRGCNYLAAAGVLASLLFSPAHIAVLRPQVFAEVLFAATLWILSQPRWHWRHFLWLAGVSLVWTNAHGSYVLCPVLVVTLAVGNSIQRVLWRHVPIARRATDARRSAAHLGPMRPLRHWLLALACSMFPALLCNPHGPWLLYKTWQFASHPNLQTMNEWQPVSFTDATSWGWWYLICLAVLLSTPVLTRRTYAAGHWLLLALFAYASYRYTRMMPWWIMLTPWLSLPLWASRFAGEYAAHPLATDAPRGSQIPAADLKNTILAAMTVVVAFLWSGPGQWLLTGTPRALSRSVHPGTPWRQAALLQHWHSTKHWHGRVFASETLGDYLLWAIIVPDAVSRKQTHPGRSAAHQPDPHQKELDGRIRIFAYTHAHLFPKGTWDDLRSLKAGAAGWDKLLDRYAVRAILVEAELHPLLRRHILASPDRWEVIEDQTGDRRIGDPKGRLFFAVRKS
ncbi:MAG: hypothetical protein C4297_09180 [Gemmataceae bacterium]